jgi:hypothetical protein
MFWAFERERAADLRKIARRVKHLPPRAATRAISIASPAIGMWLTLIRFLR